MLSTSHLRIGALGRLRCRQEGLPLGRHAQVRRCRRRLRLRRARHLPRQRCPIALLCRSRGRVSAVPAGLGALSRRGDRDIRRRGALPHILGAAVGPTFACIVLLVLLMLTTGGLRIVA